MGIRIHEGPARTASPLPREARGPCPAQEPRFNVMMKPAEHVQALRKRHTQDQHTPPCMHARKHGVARQQWRQLWLRSSACVCAVHASVHELTCVCLGVWEHVPMCLDAPRGAFARVSVCVSCTSVIYTST